MSHIVAVFFIVAVVAGSTHPAMATSTLTETTLEKIGRTGVSVVGTRTSSPPFAHTVPAAVGV